jgi:hypothetical protein
MIFTYLVLKLTLNGVVQECNRLYGEAEKAERGRYVKERLMELREKLDAGQLSDAEYGKLEEALLKELGVPTGPTDGGEGFDSGRDY